MFEIQKMLMITFLKWLEQNDDTIYICLIVSIHRSSDLITYAWHYQEGIS